MKRLSLIVLTALAIGCTSGGKETVRDISGKVPDDYEPVTTTGKYLIAGRRAYRLYKSTKDSTDVPSENAIDLGYVFKELKDIRKELKKARSTQAQDLDYRLGQVELELMELLSIPTEEVDAAVD